MILSIGNLGSRGKILIAILFKLRDFQYVYCSAFVLIEHRYLLGSVPSNATPMHEIFFENAADNYSSFLSLSSGIGK